jgi:hypothetical protein
MTEPTSTDSADAVIVTLVRHGCALIVWIAWFVTRRPHEAPAGPISLLIIVGLVGLYVLWVNKPLERALGPLYAKRTHWSGLFVMPSLCAFVMLAKDIIELMVSAFGS